MLQQLQPCKGNNTTSEWSNSTEDHGTFQSRIVLELQVSDSMIFIVDDDSSDEIADRFLQSYQEIHDSYCDPYDRTVKSVQALVPIETSAMSVSLALNIFGTCQNCADGSIKLFDVVVDNSSNATEEVDEWEELLGMLEDEYPNGCANSTGPMKGPTIVDFQKVFEGSLVNFNETGIALLSITEEEVVPCAELTPFSAELTLEYTSVCGEEIIESELQVVEQVLMETYNGMLESDYCDALFRKLTSVELVDFNLTSTTRSLLLNFAAQGECRGCSGGSLFSETDDASSSTTTRRRASQLLDLDDTSADSCACPSSDMQARAPTEAEFKARFDTVLATLFEGVTCPVDCPDKTSEWDDVVIIELVAPNCYDDDQVASLLDDSALVADLQQAFINTYNDLQQGLYCDPIARKLESAEIVTVGERNSFGNIPVEIKVQGTCGDCDNIEVRIYDVPTRNTEEDFLRQLQAEVSCACPILSASDYVRGPYEADFVEKFQASVEKLEDDCVGSIAGCDFGSVFATGLFITLETINEVELTEADIASIEESFRDATNQEYSVDDETCNPDFRIVETVRAIVVSSGNRRQLEQLQEVTMMPMNETDFNETSAMVPSMAPTFSPGNTPVVLNLYVSGICNGCGNDLFFGDAIDGRRVAQHRHLQEDGPTSNCYCPLGAVIESVAPPPERLQATFEQELEERQVPVDRINDFLPFDVPPPNSGQDDDDGLFFQQCEVFEDCGPPLRFDDEFQIAFDDDELRPPPRDDDLFPFDDEFGPPPRDDDEFGPPPADDDEFGPPPPGDDEFGPPPPGDDAFQSAFDDVVFDDFSSPPPDDGPPPSSGSPPPDDGPPPVDDFFPPADDFVP